MSISDWREDDLQTLRELWGTMAAGKIGPLLRKPRSKAAVIGKARRLGLPRVDEKMRVAFCQQSRTESMWKDPP